MIYYIDVILTNVAALGLGILGYWLLGNNTEVLLAAVAAGISISIGIRHHQIERYRLFKELFVEFNKKYDEKFNDKLNLIVANSAASEFVLSVDDKNLIVDYMNFCAEEYMWFRKDIIPKDVWKAWRSGMLHYFKKQIFSEIVKQEIGQEDSYYGLFSELKPKLNLAITKQAHK